MRKHITRCEINSIILTFDKFITIYINNTINLIFINIEIVVLTKLINAMTTRRF